MKKEAHDTSLLAHKENATFRAQHLGAVPSDLLTMHNLLFIDLSYNCITRFPGELVVQDIPRLEVLHLQHNLLYVLEDILALSVAPRLRELNVSANPLRLLDNRVYFLEALLNAPLCDIKALQMVQKDPTLTAQALSLPAAAIGVSTAFRVPKSKIKSRSSSARTMSLVRKLPRKTGFPMLQRVNGLWIMDDEIRAVELERGRSIEYYNAYSTSHTSSGREMSIKRSAVGLSLSAPGDSMPERTTDNSTNGRKFDGSRMTAKELLKHTTRLAAIPAATVIECFQIDVETNGVQDDDSKTDINEQELQEACEDSREVIQRLFAANDNGKKPGNDVDEVKSHGTTDDYSQDTWNYPVRSFDALTSDDRQYIRHRSKQSVESNLQRDDQFFDSTIFLDCIAQAERSRRLTIRAVETLCPPQYSSRPSLLKSQSTPTLHRQAAHTPVSTAAAELRDTLTSKFSKHLDDKDCNRLETFLKNPPPQVEGSVDAHDMHMALSELFLTEHVEHKQHIRQLLEAYENDEATSNRPLDVVAAQLDDSLSRTKLLNAVDLANARLLNKKQEKRMIQMLIDTDAKAIEQERASLEQALHRHRLDLIASNTYYANEQTAHEAEREWMRKTSRQKAPSPWQARNWRAKEAQRQVVLQQEKSELEKSYTSAGTAGNTSDNTEPIRDDESARPNGTDGTLPISRCRQHLKKAKIVSAAMKSRPASAAPATRSSDNDTLASATTPLAAVTKFRTIETVEQAARDPLDHIASRDLLVRCAAIRQNTDAHTKALAQYRDKFLEDEAAWEAMRQDPINIVRRHLRRKLYRDAQEIQIAGTQLFYSPLFQ